MRLSSVVDNKIRSLFARQCWTRSNADMLTVIEAIKADRIELDLTLPHVGRFSTTANFNGFRIDLDERLGKGFAEFTSFSNRYLLSFSDIFLKRAVQSRYQDSAVLVFGIRSHADKASDELTYRKGSGALIGGQSADYVNELSLPVGKPLRVLSFYLPLDDDLTVFPMALPKVRQEVASVQQHLQQQGYFYSHFHESKQAVRTLNDIILNSYRGQLRHDFIWVKLQELLCDYEQICSAENAMVEDSVYRFTHSDLKAIQKAKNIIEAGYASKLLEDEIARDVGLSRTRLRVFFEKQYGDTVHGFTVKFRINKAQSLLTETDLSIGEIATAVGYGHASSFRQAFKKVLGITPKEVQRR